MNYLEKASQAGEAAARDARLRVPAFDDTYIQLIATSGVDSIAVGKAWLRAYDLFNLARPSTEHE